MNQQSKWRIQRTPLIICMVASLLIVVAGAGVGSIVLFLPSAMEQNDTIGINTNTTFGRYLLFCLLFTVHWVCTDNFPQPQTDNGALGLTTGRAVRSVEVMESPALIILSCSSSFDFGKYHRPSRWFHDQRAILWQPATLSWWKTLPRRCFPGQEVQPPLLW